MQQSNEECERSPHERFLSSVHQAVRDDAWDANGKGRTLSASCVLEFGGTGVLLKFIEGRIAECTSELPLLCSRDFTIRGTTQAWRALWEPVPAPGWHDLFALSKRGEMSAEGDMQQVMAHLQFIKDLIALPRSVA